MYSVETLAFNALSVIDKVSLCGSEPFRDLKTLRSSLKKTLSCEGNRIERRLRRSQQAWLLLSVACFGRFQSRFGGGRSNGYVNTAVSLQWCINGTFFKWFHRYNHL